MNAMDPTKAEAYVKIPIMPMAPTNLTSVSVGLYSAGMKPEPLDAVIPTLVRSVKNGIHVSWMATRMNPVRYWLS